MHNETEQQEKFSRSQRIFMIPLLRGSESAGKRRRGIFTAVLVFIMVALLLSPSPFALEMPGPTANVYGTVKEKSATRMIDLSGVRTYKDKGQLRLVTVSATGVPGYSIPTAAAIYAWFHPHMAVMPQEAVYSVNTTADDYEKEGAEEMTGAQDTASHVALEYARQHFGVKTSAAKVKLNIDDIGEPSAGMIYTLGIITSLTPDDEAGGKLLREQELLKKMGKLALLVVFSLK